MKLQAHVFNGLAAFFLIVGTIYGLWSEEPVGTTALLLSGGLAGMVGFYLLFTARRVDAGPQDNKQAEVADDSGELGFYSPHSWAPITLGGGLALVFLGPVFGWWFTAFATPLLLFGLWHWVFEYYRGPNQTQ